MVQWAISNDERPKGRADPGPLFSFRRSPIARIRHRGPGFLGLKLAVLQQLDGDAVGRADKGHMAVAWRPVDDDTGGHQLGAQRINVADPIGEMAEVPPAAIAFLVPVISE